MKTLLAVLLVALFLSASMVNESKPSLPKVVRAKYIPGGERDCVEYINQCVKDGYIIKSVAGTSQYGYSWIVVAEKY